MRSIWLVLCVFAVCLVGCQKATTEQKAETKKEVVAKQADQTEAKPDEAKPDEAKPDEAKPDEQPQPGEAVPAEPQEDPSPAEAHKGHALPASLDALFPPQSEAPVFLFAMFGMAGPFEGMMNDLLQEDMEGAKTSYAAFKEAYTNTSKLVPEWSGSFPMEPVEALGAALETGDKGQIMGAFGGVGEVCGSCHHQYMVPVQAKFHWKSFADVKAQDPLRGQEVSMRDLMRTLGVTFMGVPNDLRQGQQENAQKTFEGFKATFAAMKTMCEDCHDSERAYFVDATVDAAIDELGAAVAANDAAAVQAASQKIGQQSCFGCHLVHMPPAMMQHTLAAGH